jgi:hypothetical protein
MLDVLRQIGSKSGPSPERDPDALEAWWEAVLNDPRSQRTRIEKIPADHPDACLRLDRYPQPIITVKYTYCGVQAVYAIDDLAKSFGVDHNITCLPAYLLPCPSRRDRLPPKAKRPHHGSWWAFLTRRDGSPQRCRVSARRRKPTEVRTYADYIGSKEADAEDKIPAANMTRSPAFPRNINHRMRDKSRSTATT